MKVTNNFVQGKMNKDIDERLLPKGQYSHAENLRVSSSDESDVGSVENVRGNKKLTNFGLTNAKTIGAFTDSSNQKIYWFVTADEKDLVVEYDFVNKLTNILLESTNPNGELGFNKDYLITGVAKVYNGDSSRDLLVWTDNLNPPRKINIERSKTYGADGFDKDDISLIKRPPIAAPTVELTFNTDTTENSIENKFLSFSYRYKYLDGEYSALSSYTNYKFAPSEFKVDYQTMENLGMVNAFSAVNIGFNTGDKRVTDIQIVVKESNSNALAIIETFNKVEEGWGDAETHTLKFSNSKKYIYLSEVELFRSYDNVPKVAKAMELVNNRLIFGNYTEGFDLVAEDGENINIDFDLTLLNKSLAKTPIPLIYSMTAFAADTMTLDLTGFDLKKDSKIILAITLKEKTYVNGTYQNTFSYILNRDYVSAFDLAIDPDFTFFVNSVMTDNFTTNYTAVPPADSTVLSISNFIITGSSATIISIQAPEIVYQIDDTPANLVDNVFHNETSYWAYEVTETTASFTTTAVSNSLKTNRSYEVGIIYLDDYNRASTVLTCKDNTVRIPQKFSTTQNVIVANIHHKPPAEAVRYKMVVKQNKADYQTIYTNIFYIDGLFRWVKLEGANKDKVHEGDTLLVKSDLGGVVQNVTKVRVLEVATKAADFLVGNKDASNNDIIEEAGLYMKIKPVGFDMNQDAGTFRTFEDSSQYRDPIRTYTKPEFGTRDISNVFVPYPVTAGSSIRIYIHFEAFGSIAYSATYDKRFKASADYPSVKAWFDAEVIDLGSFGTEFTWDGVKDIGGNICAGFGNADPKHRFSGWGFGEACEGSTTVSGEPANKFFVVPHRSGTATRNIVSAVRFEIQSSEGVVIFETEPKDTDNNIFYETEETFDIVDGYHLGNTQDQSASEGTAIVEMDFFNCYVQGNGAESFRYKDDFNTNFLNIDLRPSSTSIEKFKEVRRFADLTYSEPYVENTNLNSLNVFNLFTLNFKEDIDKRYGFIQKIYAKDTDLVVFQEDKVSKVLFGKDALFNADGTTNLSAIESVLGRQLMYSGEYGISRNPESFAFHGNDIYFTDAKRGCVCRLSENGIVEISQAGMVNFFKDQFQGNIDTKKFGGYDPYFDQYVLYSSEDTLTPHYKINCDETVVRNDFFGNTVIDIDYGLLVGSIAFNYDSNGLPIRYVVTYDGATILDTGYVGDSIYDDDLIALGLPATVGLGTDTFTYNKNDSKPSFITVTAMAPICGTNMNLSAACLTPRTVTIKNMILTDYNDEGRTIKSRYKWGDTSYSNPFKTYDSTLTSGTVSGFDVITGQEATINIPRVGSTVEIQTYSGINQTDGFFDGNQLGYWITDEDIDEGAWAHIVASSIFPTPTSTVGASGDVTTKVSFTYNPLITQQFLYLVWDYRNPEIKISPDTNIEIYVDSTGAMATCVTPITNMVSGLLQQRLLPLYNNDVAQYNAKVSVITFSNERFLDALNIGNVTPNGNTIAMVFQDEADPAYYSGSVITPRTSQFNTDMSLLQTRLNGFLDNYYRAAIFQVNSPSPTFKQLVTAVQAGTVPYDGANGLSTRNEFNFSYDITVGGTSQYYYDKVVAAIQALGYEL